MSYSAAWIVVYRCKSQYPPSDAMPTMAHLPACKHPTSTTMAKPNAIRLSRSPTTRLLAPARPVPTHPFKPCTHASHACTQARKRAALLRIPVIVYVHDVVKLKICMRPFIRTPVRLRSLREMREGPL